MTEKIPVLTDRETRRVEALTAPMTFNALCDLIEEVCLTNPLPVGEIAKGQDAELIAQLGLHGLRAAVELSRGMEEFPEGTDPFFLRPDEPMKTPERFSDGVDLEGIERTERLGQGLLNESFMCLGPDVFEQIEKFKNATTHDEQMNVLTWLERRLYDMTRSEAANNLRGESETFYHPLRLSPKLMGAYPEHATGPTCLGVSIIAASFLEQTGATVLHAGVMKTRIEEQRAEGFSFFQMMPSTVKNVYGLDLPHVLEESLEKASFSVMRANMNDRGYHTAVYCRMMDDVWFQLDPNFNSSGGIVSEGITQRLDEAHELLSDLKDSVPGLETGIDFSVPALPRVAGGILHYGDPSLLPEMDKVAAFLREDTLESVIERAKEQFVIPFFQNHNQEELKEVWNSFVDPEVYDDIFYKTFNKYVLWNQPLEEVLARCRHDTEYCRRRMEDIRLLPLTFLAALVANDVNESDTTLHQAIEVGLPAHRIGAAVVNDFANFYGQELPASYRISQWPSHVPLTEAINTTSHMTDAQHSLVINNASWQLGTLHYSKSDGIIINTLVHERQRRQAQDDNHRSEEAG